MATPTTNKAISSNSSPPKESNNKRNRTQINTEKADKILSEAIKSVSSVFIRVLKTYLMSKIRQQRTAEQIKIIISELLLREMNDPRLLGVTVTDVTIDRELQYADVYVHSLGDDSREDEIMLGARQGIWFLPA